MQTPVALIIFNRKDTTEKVIEALRQVKPPKLFVIADGPRPDQPGEAEKCAATRAVVDQVDWECEIFKNYSDINLGCGVRPATGISWVFDQVEEAIILEDDCLPHPTFFQFCEELLEKYRDDKRIMQIAANNFQFSNKYWQSDCSYYFSRYCVNWGWASWRRAWQYYDFNIKSWPEIKETIWWKTWLGNQKHTKYWTKKFDELYNSPKNDIWDYQWLLSCWIQNGLSITPNINLVSNIGFNEAATHTISEVSKHGNVPAKAMNFPLKHPAFVISNVEADNFLQNTFHNLTVPMRIKWKIERSIGKFLPKK